MIEVRIFQKPRKIGKVSALTFAVVAAVGLGTAVSATSASASTFYHINQADATQACNSTYTLPSYTTMSATFPAGGSTWDCGAYVYVGYPYSTWFRVQDFGAPDLQKYCSAAHPGSQVQMVTPTSSGWYCEL